MDPHLRTQDILILIEANPGITSQEIADHCGVPWSIIKNDLEVMVLAENNLPLYTDCDAFDEDEESNDEFSPETKWYLETSNRSKSSIHLTVGEAIQVLSLPEFNDHPKLLSLRQKLVESLDLENQGSFRYIKGSMGPSAEVHHNEFLLLEQVIIKGRKVRFTYNTYSLEAVPLGLVYYSRLRQWYLVAKNHEVIKTYYLGNIKDLKELAQPFNYPSDFSLKNWLAPRWGMEFGDPIRVKVKFINRAQTLAKVRKDVVHRDCSLKVDKDGDLIYEDTIIGKNEFIAWLLGFGSAAVILDPKDLREEMIARVKATLGNYQRKQN